MSDYDPSELLLVCDSIIEDGELTYDELYQLAEWLNSHREACVHWPGSLLVEPLQRTWADGKITKTEARQFARLLFQIRKEAAKRETEQQVTQAVEIAAQTVHTFNLEHPRLPAIPFSARIKSHKRKGEFYEVDLSGPVCSYPDFRSFRQRLPVGHLTRCCKHVFDAYAQFEPAAGWPGWLGSFINHAFPPHPKHEWHVLKITPGWFSLGGQTSFVLIHFQETNVYFRRNKKE